MSIKLSQIIDFRADTIKTFEDFIKKNHSNPEWLWTLEDPIVRTKLNQFRIRDEENNWVGITSFQQFSNYLGVVQKHIIDSDHRGKGYGSKALEILAVKAKNRGIKKLAAYILETNLASLSTFQKQGFKIEGYLRDHFSEGMGCYVLGKVLE